MDCNIYAVKLSSLFVYKYKEIYGSRHYKVLYSCKNTDLFCFLSVEKTLPALTAKVSNTTVVNFSVSDMHMVSFNIDPVTQAKPFIP